MGENKWSKKLPSKKEGFYFWKPRKNLEDQFYFSVYGFFESGHDNTLTCWDQGTEVHPPENGWWKGPIKI